MVPSFRENGAELWRGRTMESFLLYYAGYDEGARIEDGRNDLPIAVPIASQTLHAVGIGLGINYRKTDQVVLVFFGDGATSEGDFHEAMNFAAVFQAPVVFVCQNNQWAISVPRDRQTRSETLAQKVVAYGMPGIQVDGNDILAVYAATKEAVDRARSGGGPTMIECVTYRVVMHTTSDDPKRYRSETEAQDWMKKDPLVRFQRYLIGRKLLTDKKIEAAEAEVKAEIQASVERFEQQASALGDPLDMFNHAYAEMPSTLLEQREELRRELGANGHTTAADVEDAAAIIRQIFTEQPLKATATLRPEVAANGEETGRG
ncbi:MAG TPA: thiamine pyrophosphate-dependent enzyme, partial [Chloroflexota bacterium]|nr:thiamine pyrophosphate-dependent enzyme [Chloroflexota bacterium]